MMRSLQTNFFGDRPRAAFTLIELMVVIALLGLILAFSIPAIREATHREALSQAVHDVMDACSRARARAILSGTPMEVQIHAADRSIEVVEAPQDADPTTQVLNALSEPAAKPGVKSPDAAPEGSSAHISDELMIDMIDVNLVEYKDEPEAHIRFFPNGTSDEFTLIMHSAGGEYRKVWLEVVTALADVSSDIR